MRPVRAKALNIARSFKAFALTGRQVTAPNNPGRCPGLRASALSGRAACIHCSGLRAFGPSGRAACIHCPELRAFGLQPVLRNLSKQYVRWAPQKAIPPKSHKRTERQGHPPAPEKHPPASEKHPPASEKHPHSILPRRSPPSRNEPGRRAPCGTHDNS